MFAIAGSGIAIAYGYASPLMGGLFTNVTIATHETSLGMLPFLILHHIAGALWHKVIRRDRIPKIMIGKLSN